MRSELGEFDRGADLERAPINPDRAQLLDIIDVDEHRRSNDAAPDIDHEIGPTAKQAAVGVVCADADHLVERRRTHERKLRQRVH
jgi:hypothetical protein